MDIILYPKLSTRSRRAFWRTGSYRKRPYGYNPRYDLIERLSRETGQTREATHEQLLKERRYLLSKFGVDTWEPF